MNEPHHPRLRQYVHQLTTDWSAIVDAADAFAFVMPEYDFTLSAPLKNAIDYLHSEWAHKPVGFVSYGGISAGLRAVQSLKQVATTLSMFPLATSVALPFVAKSIVDGRLEPDELAAGSAPQLTELGMGDESAGQRDAAAGPSKTTEPRRGSCSPVRPAGRGPRPT